jgi:flavodoxin
MSMFKVLPLFCIVATCSAWIVPTKTRSVTRLEAAVGIFYGTSTGSTQSAAEAIFEALGDLAAEPVDIETIDDVASAFASHGALIVGTPTWNTGADSERSGTGWDELYYDKMPDMKEALSGKKVAVFGLGDQISYAENYADAVSSACPPLDLLSSLAFDSPNFADGRTL